MRSLALAAPLFAAWTSALTLDVTNEASIRSAAQTVATRMLTYYNGGTPGQIITGVPGAWWTAQNGGVVSLATTHS